MTDHTVVVPIDLDRDRADRIVAVTLDVSRSVARAVIDAGDACVDGSPVQPSDKLSSGTRLDVHMPEVDVRLEPDAEVPFETVHADDALLIVDKPIGVVVHPTSPRSTGTLVHGLIAQYPEIRGVGQEGRWGIVHRLDRDTSGLLVVARTHDAYAALSEMIRQRQVDRRYLSLVDGSLDSTNGTIDAPIGRDSRNSTRMRVERGGRSAITHYRRLAIWDKESVSLASVSLETGRTHQIRVHMRAIDHPIIGDRAYGKAGTKADPGRPWLHARQLAFAHPESGKAIDVTSPLPNDLVDSLDSLGDPDHGELTDVGGGMI
ncbi:MAG: RluA family pseudouridine synthase [Acidimicrobiia bacterium]